MAESIFCLRCCADFDTPHGLEDHLRETECGQILVEEAMVEQEFRMEDLRKPFVVREKKIKKVVNWDLLLPQITETDNA